MQAKTAAKNEPSHGKASEQAQGSANRCGGATTQMPPQKEYPEHLKPILERAMQGDRTVLPALKKAFDENPEWVDLFGDLTEQARQLQMSVIAGDGLLQKEAIARKFDETRASLRKEASSPLESLLVDRICLDGLAVQQAEITLNQAQLSNSGAHPATRAADQRLDSAHRRYMSAIKTLATVQKLLRPAPSVLDMLTTARDKAPAPQNGRRDGLPVSEGVPVVN